MKCHFRLSLLKSLKVKTFPFHYAVFNVKGSADYVVRVHSNIPCPNNSSTFTMVVGVRGRGCYKVQVS